MEEKPTRHLRGPNCTAVRADLAGRAKEECQARNKATAPLPVPAAADQVPGAVSSRSYSCTRNTPGESSGDGREEGGTWSRA